MKKYAIYKSETGYYYYRYADCPEQLEDTKLRSIITEDKFPVLIDDKGGYYLFSKNDYGFVKIIETDDECPLSLEEMYFKNDRNFSLGWISPEGDTYSCSYTNHTKCAKMLAEKFFRDSKFPEHTLGRAGWIKVIDSWDGTQREHGQFVYSFTDKITRCQADKLFDLGLYNNDEVKKLMQNSENYW